jgi:hypothetical protein
MVNQDSLSSVFKMEVTLIYAKCVNMFIKRFTFPIYFTFKCNQYQMVWTFSDKMLYVKHNLEMYTSQNHHYICHSSFNIFVYSSIYFQGVECFAVFFITNKATCSKLSAGSTVEHNFWQQIHPRMKN